MAYENIGMYIARTTTKIIILWSLFFLLTGTVFYFYNQENKKLIFMQEQMINFTEMNNQATSVLYYNSQQNKNSEIDYDKTSLYLWLGNNSNYYKKLIKLASPEIDLLSNLGGEFYTTKSPNKTTQIQAFQNLDDQIELLKRMTENYITKISVNIISQIFFPIILGILLILIGLTILLSNNLKKTLISKNKIILEDIWNELQDVNLETANSIPNNTQQDFILCQSVSNSIIEEMQKLIIQTTIIKESLIICNQHLNQILPPEIQETNPQVQEKIAYIQKLLSRLFTRAERAASLAKATTDNGFQAGILALNVSIEATRIGESGKNFLSVSDRIKDFAEKNSHIGTAILEELKDADLSIRKAYTLGKEITSSISQTQENNNITQNKVSNTVELQEIIVSFDYLFKLIMYIQKLSKDLKEKVVKQAALKPTSNISPRTLEFMKDIMIKSFERLYRINYGIDPPSFPPTDHTDYQNNNIS